MSNKQATCEEMNKSLGLAFIILHFDIWWVGLLLRLIGLWSFLFFWGLALSGLVLSRLFRRLWLWRRKVKYVLSIVLQRVHGPYDLVTGESRVFEKLLGSSVGLDSFHELNCIFSFLIDHVLLVFGEMSNGTQFALNSLDNLVKLWVVYVKFSIVEMPLLHWLTDLFEFC